MSGIYASLQVSPRKKRCPPEFDDEFTSTPKRLRTAPPTPPATASRRSKPCPLPGHLARLNTIQTALQHALSHALATCAVSPSADTGLVCNVLNNFSLTTYTGLSGFDVDDLNRLCWIWEWDAFSIHPRKRTPPKAEPEEDNPFVESEPVEQAPKDWRRGDMGVVLSPTTHHPKAGAKRITAYGIGIEVEMDIDKGMGGGMAAVARWTAGADARRTEFRAKLDAWVKLHTDSDFVPQIPSANLPPLFTPLKPSTLTRALVSASPKGLALPTYSEPPPSPTRSPVKRSAPAREFGIPFSLSPAKPTLLFPQTPSRRKRVDDTISFSTPGTPSTPRRLIDPVTPSHQRGRNADTVPQTPTSSRRQALYDRVRERSMSPSKPSPVKTATRGSKLSKEQLAKMSQEEMRKRCLLGRLDGIAESVWMLFSAPSSASAALATRKRRALPMSSVATAIVKSSPVPISSAEANESLTLLTTLCPFFLKPMTIGGEAWLEMPAPAAPTDSATLAPPPSPVKGKHINAQELVTRSPRRVKKEAGGLREVRQIIEREMLLQD